MPRMELTTAEAQLIKDRRALESEFRRGVQTVMASVRARKEHVLQNKMTAEQFFSNLEEMYGA